MDEENMKIFVMGLTSTSLGAMEYHNLGNYAIMEPLIKYLKKEFPHAEITTSIQMSDDFCKKFNIESKRDERFWTYGVKTAITTAVDILKISVWAFFYYIFHLNLNFILKKSVLLNELQEADLIIDFSGDLYGDNSEFNRFLEGCARILFAKILGKPVVMFAGSPGPFGSTWRRMLAKFVLNRVDLITNREPLSTELLQEMGITNTHMVTTACPAFLFDAKRKEEAMDVLKNERILPKTKPLVGFILSGWNMPKPPFFKVPRDDEELKPFVDLIGHILEHYDVKVVLMAHQNRTDDQGNLIPGSDYHIISQLYSLLNHQYQDDELTMVKGLYDAATMKTIIGCCDFLISGRLHGAIAGLSQCIPTVIIDYGNGPRPHKLRGIAKLVGIEAYICDPTNAQDMIEKVSLAWENRDRIREYLKKRMPEVKKLAKYNFEILHSISK